MKKCPRLFAFDLDGTLLRSDKTLSPANLQALVEIVACGAIVTFASGRAGESIIQYFHDLPIQPALLALNGAAVYQSQKDGGKLVHTLSLPSQYADYLIDYSKDKPFACNYYLDGRLYAVRNEVTAQWTDLYFAQTKTPYDFPETLDGLKGNAPFKMLFIGSPDAIDIEQQKFVALWGSEIYIVRTWDYYLEFMHRNANKASGLAALASSYGFSLDEVVAFGDAENDVPMLEEAGLGIAMKNATPSVQSRASRVSSWTNDEDGVAREWEIIRKQFFA